MRPILVSACLLGLATRYDGSAKETPHILAYLRQNQFTAIPVCPEQLGGLPTPRDKVFFNGGDGVSVLNGEAVLVTAEGRPMDGPFLLGAYQVLKIAEHTGCRQAILKERSPSCGSNRIYQGSTLTTGQGVTCALLRKNGITVFSEETLPGFSSINETLT